jgi:hypothetical protein
MEYSEEKEHCCQCQINYEKFEKHCHKCKKIYHPLYTNHCQDCCVIYIPFEGHVCSKKLEKQISNKDVDKDANKDWDII